MGTDSTTKEKHSLLIPGDDASRYYETTISDGKDSVTGYGDKAESSQRHAKEEWSKRH